MSSYMSYKVRTREGIDVYLVGSQTVNFAFISKERTPLLLVRIPEEGEPTDIYIRKRNGEETKLASLGPNEILPVLYDDLRGVFARCHQDSVLECTFIY